MRLDELYVGVLGGILTLVGLGVLGQLLGIGSAESLPYVTLSGTYVLWRAVILLSVGLLYLSAAYHGLSQRRNQAVVVMASIMIWIVAGTDLLGTVLGAIAGSPDVWVAGPGEVVAALGPPYQPSLLAVPLTAIALRYLYANSNHANNADGPGSDHS